MLGMLSLALCGVEQTMVGAFASRLGMRTWTRLFFGVPCALVDSQTQRVNEK